MASVSARFLKGMAALTLAAGGVGSLAITTIHKINSSTGNGSILSSESGEVGLTVAHDDVRLGSDHCDCTPLWECMVAKCEGQSCKTCAPLELQLRTCLAKVR